MEIVLLRHGKPDFAIQQRIPIRELPYLIRGYNEAGVRHSPPQDSWEVAQSCHCVVCSDLPRSIQSAQRLGLADIHLSTPMLREIELPIAPWPSPRMAPWFWILLFRLLWSMGYGVEGETLSQVRRRAMNAVHTLTGIARQHGRVLLVGHGLLNLFIAKELLSYGWQGPRWPLHRYWDYSVYSHHD